MPSLSFNFSFSNSGLALSVLENQIDELLFVMSLTHFGCMIMKIRTTGKSWVIQK